MEQEQQEKQNAMFNQLAIWDLSGEQKEQIAHTIITDVETGIEYWSQMILSAIIASLGLLINATPVVIGAMLIAPILRPIQAVAFATTTGNKRLFWKGTWLLIMSIIVSIFAAVIITLMIPLSQVTNEILARTQPTLIDLGIAFASGIIAFLAFGYEKIAAGLAGVAMAASLVPPLAVIGVGIGMLDAHIARNSSVLFLTNLFAIIVAGIGIFYMFGYYPNQKKELKTSIINTSFVLGILVLLCIPLATTLINIVDGIEEKNRIDTVTKSYFQQVDHRISIEGIDYKRNAMLDKDIRGAELSIDIKAPQDIVITNTQKDELTRDLADTLSNSIALDLTIIPYSSVSIDSLAKIDPLEQVENHITTFIQTLYPPAVHLKSEFLQQSKKILLTEFYTEESFDANRFQQSLASYLKDRGVIFDILIVDWREPSVKEEVELTQSEQKWQETIDALSSHFRASFPESTLQKLQLYRGDTRQEGKLELTLITPLPKEEFNKRFGDRKKLAGEISDLSLSVKGYVQYAEVVEIE